MQDPGAVAVRARGVVCGAFAGDVLGAPFEGESSESIKRICLALNLTQGPRELVDCRQFPDALASAAAADIDLIGSQPETVGQYTDDTECTLALCESIVECNGVDSEHVALSTALWFAREPQHGGYSALTFEKLVALQCGTVSFSEAGNLHDAWLHNHANQGMNEHAATGEDADQERANGSFGNGAPMRIAPVGVAYRHLKDSPDRMREVVQAAVSFTHTHPEAIDSATVLALAVARCCEISPGALADPASGGPAWFLEDLASRSCVTKELQTRLTLAAEGLKEHFARRRSRNGDGSTLADERPMFCAADKELLQSICTPGKWFQIRAVDAITYVLFYFCKYGGLDAPTNAHDPSSRPLSGDSFFTCVEDALCRIVAVGGDTDTLACMLGALLGALHGDKWIAERWTRLFESSPVSGWPRAFQLGTALANVDIEGDQRSKQLVSNRSVLVDNLKRLLLQIPTPVRHVGI